MIVDLLFCSCGIEPELVAAAEVVQVTSALQVPVATTGHLLAMKLLAYDEERRPKDGLDITELLKNADEDDLVQAREAVALVMERGFGRDRKMFALLEQFQR